MSNFVFKLHESNCVNDIYIFLFVLECTFIILDKSIFTETENEIGIIIV